MTTGAFNLKRQSQAGPSESMERLENAARVSVSWDIVHRPSSPGTFPARARAAKRNLEQLERALAERSARHSTKDPKTDAISAVLLELQAQHRALRAALVGVSGRRRIIARLPRVLSSAKREEPRILAVSGVYLNAVDGEFSTSTLVAFLHSLQMQDPLTLDELWNIAPFLQFSLLESLLRDTHGLLHLAEPDSRKSILLRLESLRTIRHAEWTTLIEPLILFDALLFQDPSGTYRQMDFESRQFYRRRIASIARQSDCTEMEIAQAALDLARDGVVRPSGDSRTQLRRIHVGYYLLDKGFSRLSQVVGFHPSPTRRMQLFVHARAEDFYLGGIFVLSLAILSIALFPVLPQFGSLVSLAIAILALLPSAMQNAVELVNSCVTALFAPEPLPKLDFSRGIPKDCATLVAVPTLLLSEKQVQELVTNLEVRFLANRDPQLHFALLTDLPDSVSKPRERDIHPLVELAIRLIDELNAKYGSRRDGSFMLLHRHRIFNQRQGVWMGWERKRGKLLDLNRFLAGEFDAFPIKAGPVDVLRGVRYIVTLDSDTQLPRGAAAQLAGAIAHPLNQAVIDPKLRIVTSGYGILQPRVGIAVHSASRSRLAAIFSGQSGFDIYTRAISDSYQDLFGEGIFAGKGIYEVSTLHAVLNHRFPRNALLSHDLIEGAYARVGLTSDIELVDDYPSHYSAYSRRQHRWVRGDWQIAQWLFSRVPDEGGRMVPNPISAISRWKIFDNLRRSLVDPSLLILFVAGWLGLPGGALYWTIAALCLLAFPLIVQFGFGLGRAAAGSCKGKFSEALSGLGKASLVALLHLILLMHQTMLIFDAVIRSLIRRFITGERLLEWETAAQAESQTGKRAPVDQYLATLCFVALALGVAIWLFTTRSDAMLYAAPLLVIWAFSSFAATWLNQPLQEGSHINVVDREFLAANALRSWRYFYEFSSARHNYLIPDNVVEDGLYEACRVSPTNMGLLLNARQAACEFGFLTVPEFAQLSTRTLATIERLEKFRGNLFNWYDTETLQRLDPPFISTVDSGNFVASLYALHGGAQELGRRALLQPSVFDGLRACWRMMRTEDAVPRSITQLRLPGNLAGIPKWIEWTSGARAALSAANESQPANGESSWWRDETLRRISAIQDMLDQYFPWMLDEFKAIREPLKFARASEQMFTIRGATVYAESLVSRIDSAASEMAENASHRRLAERLRGMLVSALGNLSRLAGELRAIENLAESLAESTEFAFLVYPGRQVLSIGFDAGAQRISEYCYDLFASEARLAAFLAVARGEMPQQGWFKLEREHTYAFGRYLPVSWTGTMFEYLMPRLWMRSYRSTLTANTESACVHVQRAFARRLHIPWGISESGSARRNDSGHYSYHAYGLPCVALSPDAKAGPVVSPYSTFLAIDINPRDGLANLRRMEAAGWIGSYGYYEAADYTASLRSPILVREWMAHHLGMSLLAIANLLCHGAAQRWFHANPVIQATELLLHELPASNALLKARHKELASTASA